MIRDYVPQLAFALLVGCGTEPLDQDVSEDTTGTEDTTTTEGPSGSTSEAEPGEAVCCGCLCVDARWSCSAETCVDADGLAVDTRAEAGFYELPPTEAALDGRGYTAPKVRMWYAFQPAREAPEQAPLLVFTNGGPGAATTSGLLSMNVGERRVDTEVVPPVVESNPDAWTRFANLLFVDARTAGFSYQWPSDSPEHHHVDQDAADVLRVTLRFIESHPLIRAERVVFVGESYAGLRLAALASIVWDQEALSTGHGPDGFVDAELQRMLQASSQDRFSEFVTIQGTLVSDLQEGEFSCPTAFADPYACNHPAGDSDRRFEATSQVVVVPEQLSELTGVDVSGIEWMYAEHREQAARRFGTGPDNAPMEPVFGEQPRNRPYFLRVSIPESFSTDFIEGHLGARFLDALPHTRWMLTDARQDRVVVVPAALEALYRDFPERLTGAYQLDDEVVRFEFVDGSTRDLFVPVYEDAGHAVPAYAPTAIRNDVERWLGGDAP